MRIAVAEAKAQFSELLRRAEAGEEIELTRYGRPVARLVAAAPSKPSREGLFGALKGRVWIAPDFDELPEELLASFEAPVDPTS